MADSCAKGVLNWTLGNIVLPNAETGFSRKVVNAPSMLVFKRHLDSAIKKGL